MQIALDRPRLPSPLIVIGALTVSSLVGTLLAVHLLYGLVLLALICYLPAAVRDVRVAVVLWVPLLFLEGTVVGNLAAKGGGLVVLLSWALHLWRERATPRARRPVGVLLIVVVLLLFLAWCSLSALWAADPSRALADLWHWYAVAMLYVVVVTTFDSVGAVLALAGGFVVGGACSGLLSLGSGGLLASAGTTAQRAQGGAGDPNFLASWLLSAVVLGLALAAGVDRRARALVLTGIALLVTVLLATLSRGAFVAAAVTFVLAMLLLRDYRRQLAAVAGACAVTAAVFLTAFPDALQRLLSNDRGDGRYDLWTVAWRVARSNPLHGVGLDGFTVVAVDYMRQVDPIRATYLMASNTPHVVHNTYLQLLAELGVVGLVLFAGVAFGSLACAAVAAGRAHRAGDDRAARTAHAVLLAGVGGLVSGVFLSSGLDQLLWVVLALGPALLSAPRAQQRRSATHGSRTSSLFTQSTPTPSASL